MYIHITHYIDYLFIYIIFFFWWMKALLIIKQLHSRQTRSQNPKWEPTKGQNTSLNTGKPTAIKKHKTTRQAQAKQQQAKTRTNNKTVQQTHTTNLQNIYIRCCRFHLSTSFALEVSFLNLPWAITWPGHSHPTWSEPDSFFRSGSLRVNQIISVPP
jgi:hypothetical protein